MKMMHRMYTTCSEISEWLDSFERKGLATCFSKSKFGWGFVTEFRHFSECWADSGEYYEMYKVLS